MRTRLSVCARKTRFASEPDALVVTGRADVPLRSYRCNRCRQFHLTSRTKGKRVVRHIDKRDGALLVAPTSIETESHRLTKTAATGARRDGADPGASRWRMVMWS